MTIASLKKIKLSCSYKQKNKYIPPRAVKYCYRLNMILFLFFFAVSTAKAASYTAIAGGTIQLGIINQEQKATSIDVSSGSLGGTYVSYFGGITINNGSNCPLSSQIVNIDNRRGVKAVRDKIIVGLTGTISGAKIQLCNSKEAKECRTYSGSITYDDNGFASVSGDADPASADYLCAGIQPPWGRDDTYYTGANNPEWGNRGANFNLNIWIYVPVGTPPGNYQVTHPSLIVQGAGISNTNNNIIKMLDSSDTITVLPPPCTISVQDTITFMDTSPDSSMKVVDQLIYQCGDVGQTAGLDAFLVAYPTATIATTSTELPLVIDGTKPGGVIRGFLGSNAINDAGCNDAATSLQFNATFSSKLGIVTSGSQASIPLVWKLCRKGDETPGIATGSLTLEIGYK